MVNCTIEPGKPNWLCLFLKRFLNYPTHNSPTRKWFMIHALKGTISCTVKGVTWCSPSFSLRSQQKPRIHRSKNSSQRLQPPEIPTLISHDIHPIMPLTESLSPSPNRLQAQLQLPRHRRQRRLRQLHPQQSPRGRGWRLAAVAATAAQPEGSPRGGRRTGGCEATALGNCWCNVFYLKEVMEGRETERL